MTDNVVKQNSWYKYNKKNTVFVFIHGFFSDSKKCWSSAENVFWPELVHTDPRFCEPSIFMAGYYTDIDSGSYKISDCAAEVFAGLNHPGLNGECPAMEKDNIVFVCHSLGGIVARYMIEINRERFVNKAVGLILIASPSYGSDYANNLSLLIRFYKNRIGEQLKKSNTSLIDLDDRFRALVHKGTLPKLVGAEAVEHHFVFHSRFLPGFAPVVSKDSASRYFGPGLTLAGTNHSTCVKPNNFDHVAHRFLVGFFVERFVPKAILSKTSPVINLQKIQRDSNPLFDIYEPIDEPYYLKRDLDILLGNDCQLFSVWLYGASGVGKTAATRRRVFRDGKNPIQIYIGAMSETNVDHIALLNEIYYTVCDVVGVDFQQYKSPHKIVEKIGSMLVKKGVDSGVILVVDEIPLVVNPEVEIPRFLRAIINIISYVKRESGITHACVLLSSIFDPCAHLEDHDMKIREHVKFVMCETWSDGEISNLIEILENNLKLHTSVDFRCGLLKMANGSPRRIKTHFKEMLSDPGSNLA